MLGANNMPLLDIFKKGKKLEEKKPIAVPVLPEEIYETAKLELQDIIAPSALKIGPRALNLGTKIARTFFIISFPRFLSDNWFSPVINLDRIFDVSISISPVDTTAILRKFQKKTAEVASQIASREERGLVRDPMLDAALENLETLRDSLQQAEQKMFDIGLYLTIYAENEKKLSRAETEIKQILDAQLVYVKPALFQQVEGFKSTIPIGTDELGVRHKLNTEPVSSLFPFVSFDLTSDKGILFGINRHNSSLIIFDRFSLPNYNSVIFAKSGAGKSYATKLEILRSLMYGIDVIIIDPEREYEYLAETVGGRYLNVSLTSENHINPFDLPPVGEGETPGDVLRSQIITLVGLFRILFGGMTAEEDSIVDRAIAQTYAIKDITPDSDFSEIEPPLLKDFEMVLSGMEGSEKLVNKLKKFTEGSWAGFMNQPTNVDISKKLVVFSVRDLEDELKPAAMYIIMNNIWTNVRKDLKKRLLVVDEAWWMMKSEDTASFMFSLAKRGRKYYLGLATITQDVGDFLKSPYGVPIITNSSLQLLLKQAPSAMDVLQKTFNLTDEERFLLLEANIGEGIFFAGLKHAAIKIIASYTEDQIITSDPSQILAIKKAKEELAKAEAAGEAPTPEEVARGEAGIAPPEPEAKEGIAPKKPSPPSSEEEMPEAEEEGVKAEVEEEKPPEKPKAPPKTEVEKLEEEIEAFEKELGK